MPTPPPLPRSTETPNHEHAGVELERLLAAPAFAGAGSHARLLRHLHRYAQEPARLKESVIGIEVFLRAASSFDPRRDSIVRVEARRLRERLRQHYERDRSSPWVVTLPKGAYRLQWQPQTAESANAAELVERGQFFLRQGDEEGTRKALARFAAAVELAPDLAAGHAGLARARLALVATHGEPPLPVIDQALQAVRAALALQPAHAESLVLAAQLTHRFAFDWPAAKALFERALRAAPGSAYVHHALALSLMMRGEFEAAEVELSTARAVDPLHLALRAHQALLHLYRRQWAAADAALQALLDMSPASLLGGSLRAYAALCSGDAQAALERYRAVAAAHPNASIGTVGEAQALAALGDREGAVSAVERLRTAHAGRYLSPYQLAMISTRLGAADDALAQLDEAVSQRDSNALCLPVDPAFDTLRMSTGFDSLRRQVLG